MKKKLILGLALLLSIILITGKAQAATFSDDFNDGNADGWISIAGYPPGTHGNWRVEDGVVIQDQGHDHYGFVLDNFSASDQTVEAKVLWHDNGYAGITIWSQDANNWVQISYPYQGGFGIWENVNGNGLVYPTAIYPVEINQRIWQTMKIEANSSTGEIAVYLDNVYKFTHTVGANAHRTGLSGFNSGNAGGSFDDFHVTSNEIPVTIDIRPWVKSNTINIKNMKMVNVALLATNNFSPFKQVDTKTLTFGATGDESSLLSCLRKARDVNRDGFADLICSFSTKLTGLKCGDKEVILKGKIKTTGTPFEAKQDVLIKPCKNFK